MRTCSSFSLTATLLLTLQVFVCSLAQGAFVAPPDVGGGKPVGPINWGPGPTSGGNNNTPSGPSAADLAAQQRRQEAHNLNEQGLQYWNNQQWKLAAEAFKAASEKNPNNETIRSNYEKALAQVQAEKDAKEADRKRQQQETDAVRNMRRVLLQSADQIGAAAPLSKGLDFDGRTGAAVAKSGASTVGGLAFMRPASSTLASTSPLDGKPLNSDPMVVDLRGRLRDSVNMAVVSGGLPTASQAGELNFMPAGGATAAVPPPPKLQGVARQMAAHPRIQDSHAEMSAGQLRGDKALADKGRADGMEAFNGILDQTLKNLINDALKKPGQTTAPAGMEKLEKALDKAWEEYTDDIIRRDFKKGQVDELRTRIHKQTDATLQAAQNRFFDQLGADIKDIKKRGLVAEGDNFIEKMDTDMRVRQAVDKAILSGFFKLIEDCGTAHAKSVDDFALEMKRLVDQPNAKSATR